MLLKCNFFRASFFHLIKDLRAVYTGIKNLRFSHIPFFLKVARQLPLNTAKNLNKKPHLRSAFFWNSVGFSLFFANVKHPLHSRWYYSGFWSRGTWPSGDSYAAPRRTSMELEAFLGVQRTIIKGSEKLRMRTTYQKTSMRFCFFHACAFLAPKTKSYGFFWECKQYNKTPVFSVLVFAN